MSKRKSNCLSKQLALCVVPQLPQDNLLDTLSGNHWQLGFMAMCNYHMSFYSQPFGCFDHWIPLPCFQHRVHSFHDHFTNYYDTHTHAHSLILASYRCSAQLNQLFTLFRSIDMSTVSLRMCPLLYGCDAHVKGIQCVNNPYPFHPARSTECGSGKRRFGPAGVKGRLQCGLPSCNVFSGAGGPLKSRLPRKNACFVGLGRRLGSTNVFTELGGSQPSPEVLGFSGLVTNPVKVKVKLAGDLRTASKMMRVENL